MFLLLAGTALCLQSQEAGSFRISQGWEFYRGDLAHPWEGIRTGRPAELPLWEPVVLPHCFNARDGVDPDVAYYQGPAWYRNYLEMENPHEDGRTVLHFEGAGQKTQVFVAGFRAGEHTGGYDEFSIDLTESLEAFHRKYPGDAFEGKIPLLIRVDNSRDREMIPSDLSDFNLYGGIYRYLNLQYLPPVSLSRALVSTALDAGLSAARIRVDVEFYNPEGRHENLDLEVEIISPSGRKVATQKIRHSTARGGNASTEFSIHEPELWSPDSPQLYTVSVKCTSDTGVQVLSERFGLRHFEFVSRGPFRLNGERLLLRGTHRHEDHAGVGAAMTEDMIREEMLMMKEMGVNFIRLGHYQQSRIVLDLCDELGILVWEEIPWCRGGLGGEAYREQARRMLTNMIRQHYNHPSVILWGLGNENDWPGDFETFEEEPIREFMKELHDLSHRLDPSRLTAIRRCDFCKDIVDVYSPSIWAGWYRGKYTDYREVSRQNMQEVEHFLHVEWGASNHALRHSENPDLGLEQISSGEADERDGDFLMQGGDPRVSRDGDWTESYAVNLIDWHLKEQETMDWLTGTAYWPFKDFSTPLRPENPVPFVNQKGVVERDLQKKESFYVFQSYWTEEPMAHIYGHTWTTRWGTPGQGNMVKVYSNCPEAELFLNGVSQGRRERDSRNFPAAGLRWIVKFREGENTLHVRASREGVRAEDRITVNFQTRSWGVPARLVLEELGRQNDTATLRALVLDDQGVLCLDAREFVRFGLTGDGELIDNLGTSSGSRKVQLYNGRAMIKVRLKAGSSVASVSSAGLPSAFCTLAAKPAPERKAFPSICRDGSLPTEKQVLEAMTRVCDWQLANMPRPGPAHPRRYNHWDWTNAALHTGIMAHYRTCGKKKYLKALEGFAEDVNWQLGPRFRHADDYCIGQVYLELNELNAAPYKVRAAKVRIDSLMADPLPGRVDWNWCDALYMAPPAMARLSALTGERSYLDFMNDMWWDATAQLYDSGESLYYRDDRFRIKKDGSGRREPDGSKIFWSRGNGWVMAGTCRVLDYMPADYPHREKYESLLKQMALRIRSLQGADGLWKASLLYPQGHAHGETSGSAFYCYALAWGINRGLLDRSDYLPVVLRAWEGLNAAVHPDGKLGWVQQVGSAPAPISYEVSEVYGVGAFLLAGSEVIKLLESPDP